MVAWIFSCTYYPRYTISYNIHTFIITSLFLFGSILTFLSYAYNWNRNNKYNLSIDVKFNI